MTRTRKYVRDDADLVPMAWTDPWTPTEAEFTRLVLQVARAKQWTRRYHTHDSRRSARGFPDWVMVCPSQKRTLFLELKGFGGKPDDEQLSWLRDLAACGFEAYLVTTSGDKAHDMAALAEMFDPAAQEVGVNTRVRHGIAELEPREREVLTLYADLGRHKLVAEEMGLSEQTVKNMAANILKVLEANSIGQAAVMFDRAKRR